MVTRATNRHKSPPSREYWMELKDREFLARLMTTQGVTSRRLAEAAGWKAHSYVNRLRTGEVTTLHAEPAVRIAAFLGVGVDDLFLAKSSRYTGHTGAKSKTTKTSPSSSRAKRTSRSKGRAA